MANPLNIINEIQAPDLTNENLSASLKEVFEKINDNFKKIISAPIYRGQKGESVRIEPVTLFDEGTNTFTEEGQKLVKVIFDIDFTDWTGGKADLDKRLEEDQRYKKIGGVCASDYFKSNTSILMFQLDDVVRTNLTPAQIYAFQDNRVGYLTGQDVNFVDTSCFISFEWVEDTYNYVKINEFPTIQWSNSVNDYVWSINGQQTNIIAKGLKGMDASFTLPLFMVVDNGDYWEVTGVKQGDTIIEITDESFPWDEYNVGMGCVAYITVDNAITGLDISSIRQINKEGGTLSINKSGANIEAKQLVTMLGEIRPFEDNVVSNSNPPALFIPAGVTGLENHFHALWRNTGTGTDCKDLHMGYSKIMNNEIKPGEEWANLTLHGYNAIYFDESDDYVENPLPDNPPIPNIKLNNGIMEVSSGGINRSGFILGPNNISMSSNNVTVTSPLIKLTVDNPDNPGYINIKPGEITASTNTFTLTGSNFYLKSSSSIYPALLVDGNNIMLRKNSININSNFTSPNNILIGTGGQSNIQISGKNINVTGPTSFANDVTFNGETTFKKTATFEKETIIGGQDFSKIVNVNGWYNGTLTSTGNAIYPVEKDNNNFINIGNVWFNGWRWVHRNEDHKWYTEREMVGKNPNNYFCWTWFQPYYVQMGKMAKIWGFFTPFHDDCTNYIMDLDKIVNFSPKYKCPASNTVTNGFIIGTCQTNNDDNFSSPVMWRNSMGTCPSGTYPADDTEWKHHGWVYLYSEEPLIMFVTPKVGRTYYFEITYFVD